MIKTWICLFLVCVLVRADTMYLTGFTRETAVQFNFVFRDLDFCVSDQVSSSLLDNLLNIFLCIDKRLFHCLLESNPTSDGHSPQSYCGAFSLSQHKVVSSEMLFFIEVMKGHILHHEVLKFNFRTSSIFSCGDHGLTVSHKDYRSISFCGRRVPWTMIVKSDTSYIHLMIKTYLHYDVSIFYSSFKKNWIKQFIDARIFHPLSNKLNMYRNEINNSAQYYIVAEHYQHIYLDLLIKNRFNGSIIVYDGPGKLSNTLLILNNKNVSSDIFAKTSAFWAFVDVFITYNSVAIFEIRVTYFNNIGKTKACVRGYRIYVPKTSIYRTNAVCSDYLKWEGNTARFIGLLVKNFVFDGPNKLIDISSPLCQYGGFYIRFYSGDKRFGFCEKISYFFIYSPNNILYVTLVWFGGYSQGSFEGIVRPNDCQFFYHGYNPLQNVYQHETSIKMSAHPNCFVVVCPPVHTARQKLCTIQIGPPSLGTTRFKITTFTTLQSCDTHLNNSIASHEIETQFTTNWPFGLINSTSSVRFRELHNRYKWHSYEFLHFVKVKLSLLCNEESPRKQIAFYVKTSECNKIKNQYQVVSVNNIPALSNSCLECTYTFIAIKGPTEMKNNYHHFIYKGDGHKTKGHKITVAYKSCPVECKKFNYSVFVRNIDTTTITEYTTQVGLPLFTGHYHIGFSVKIIAPKNDCIKQICKLTLIINTPQYSVGGEHYDEADQLILSMFKNKR